MPIELVVMSMWSCLSLHAAAAACRASVLTHTSFSGPYILFNAAAAARADHASAPPCCRRRTFSLSVVCIQNCNITRKKVHARDARLRKGWLVKERGQRKRRQPAWSPACMLSAAYLESPSSVELHRPPHRPRRALQLPNTTRREPLSSLRAWEPSWVSFITHQV